MNRVLIVSEDKTAAELLQGADAEDDFEVTRTGWAAWDVKTLSGGGPVADVLVFDYRDPARIPGGASRLIAAELRAHDPRTPVVFVSELDPVMREMIQAAVGKRNVAFADTNTFGDPRRIRDVLTAFGTSGTSRKAVSAFPHLLPDLRSPTSGRLDAKRVSALFAIPINRLAASVGADAPAVYKTPDSPALQEKLLVYERIARSLLGLVGSEEGLRIWLNTPEPDLENEMPRDLLMNGEGEVVAELLQDMHEGQPG